MADEPRQKVTKAMDLCGAEYHCNTSCPYYDVGNCGRSLMNDIHTLLKAQEPIEARLNLCDSCAKLYPECDATADAIKFGCGVGNDNVIGCMAYVSRWNAQQPRVMKISELTSGEPMLVWLEDIDKKETVAGMIFDYVPGRLGFKLTDLASMDRIYPLIDEYLTRWRCWTSRPDEKRRAETPWQPQ